MPLRRLKQLFLGVLATIAVYVAWVFFQPDEALTPNLSSAATSSGSRSASDATIGLIALEAPAGSDFMALGRLAFADAVRTGAYPMDSVKQLSQEKPRLEAKWDEKLECWLYVADEKMSDEFVQPCNSPVALQAVLVENAELLQRYRLIQKMTLTADGEDFRGTPVIVLGKLTVADIHNDLRLGQVEQAYRKWVDYHRHQSGMAGYAGGWVITLINFVNEGLSFAALDLLLARPLRRCSSTVRKCWNWSSHAAIRSSSWKALCIARFAYSSRYDPSCRCISSCA